MADFTNNIPRNERDGHSVMMHKATNDDEWRAELRRVMAGVRVGPFRPPPRRQKISSGMVGAAVVVVAFWGFVVLAFRAFL